MLTHKNRIAVMALSLLLALSFVASAIPSPAQAQTCAANYTVKAGDTLYGIAILYDVSMESVATANNLTAPYLITIGQTICIPAGATVPGTSSTPAASTSTSKNPTVSISRTNYGMSMEITNFTSGNIYYVRAGELGLRTKEWTRLGLIQIKKNGTASAYYRLPKELREAETLHVCLKNARTNGVVCVRADLPNPYKTP